MVWKRVGILLNYTRKVWKPRVYVIPLNYGRPQLVLPFIHGKVCSVLRVLPSTVLASALAESRLALLLFCLYSELKAADVSAVVVRVPEVQGFGSGSDRWV